MRFIEVLQTQVKRTQPENTSALLIIVPYARCGDIPISAPRFWPGAQQMRNRTRFASPIDHPFKTLIDISLVNIHAEFQGVRCSV